MNSNFMDIFKRNKSNKHIERYAKSCTRHDINFDQNRFIAYICYKSMHIDGFDEYTVNVGEIRYFRDGGYAPFIDDYFIKCDGQLLSTYKYAELFIEIGHTYSYEVIPKTRLDDFLSIFGVEYKLKQKLRCSDDYFFLPNINNR